MERPVFVNLPAVTVVAAAGFGVLGAGIDAGREATDGGSTSAAGVTAEPPTTLSTPTTPSTRSATGTVRTAAGRANGTGTPSADIDEIEGDDARTEKRQYPPGTSPAGIEDARALLGAHTDALSMTGFVVRSRADATVLEAGMGLDATTRGGARAPPGASAYDAYRTDAAGPLRRHTEG